MSVKAYILITADTARTLEVAQALTAVPWAVEVHEVMGPYDMVVELETPELEDVTTVLRERIRAIPGVRSTLTCVVMRPSMEERHSESD